MVTSYIKNILRIYLQSYSNFSVGVWLNVFAGFVNSMGNMISVFIALYLTTQLHYSEIKVGDIILANGIGMIIGSYIGGYLCDRINSNKIAYLALIMSGITIGLFPTFQNFLALFAISLLSGISLGTFRPANTLTLFANCDESEYARVNSLYRVGSNLGFGMGTAIGGLLVAFGYEFVYLFNSLTNIISAILLIVFANTFKVHIIEKKIPSKLINNITEILSNKIFILLSFLLFINLVIFMQIKAPYEIYLHQQYQISIKSISYLFLLNSIIIVLFEVPIINALKNRNQITIAMIGSFFTALGMFLLSFGHTLLFALICCFILTIGQILFVSPMFALAMARTTKGRAGMYMGIYQAIFSCAMIVGPKLGTTVAAFDGGAFIWHLCGILGIISLLGFYWLHFSYKNAAKANLEISLAS